MSYGLTIQMVIAHLISLKVMDNLDRNRDLFFPKQKSFSGTDTLIGEATLFQNCFATLQNGVYTKKKKSKFFPFRIDPFQKEIDCRKANKKSQKLSPL